MDLLGTGTQLAGFFEGRGGQEQIMKGDFVVYSDDNEGINVCTTNNNKHLRYLTNSEWQTNRKVRVGDQTVGGPERSSQPPEAIEDFCNFGDFCHFLIEIAF